MTYKQLLEALQALPSGALDHPVTVHFNPGGSGPLVFPIQRVAPAGEVLAGHPMLGMLGDDQQILSGNRR